MSASRDQRGSRAPALVAAGLAVVMASVMASSPGRAEEILYEQKLEPYPFPITVPARIGDGTYTFILDTGGGPNGFDPSLSKLLGPPRGTRPASEFRRNLDLTVYDCPPIILGGANPLSTMTPALSLKGDWGGTGPRGITLLHMLAIISDCARYRADLGIDIRGVLGLSFWNRYALVLDYDHHALRVTIGPFTPPAGMESLDLGTTLDAPSIRLAIEGTTEDFVVDTGFNGSVGLRDDLFKSFVAKGIIKPSGEFNGAAGGQSRDPVGWFNQGQLLGLDLNAVPVVDVGNVNVVGLEFMANFNVIVDFKNAKFWYRDRQAPPAIRLNKMLGAILKFSNGHNHIFEIDPQGGAAREAGLKIWDRIVRLGPLREADLNAVSIYELCLSHANETLDVEVTRPGESQRIIAKLKLPEKQYEYPPRKAK